MFYVEIALQYVKNIISLHDVKQSKCKDVNKRIKNKTIK